MSLPVFLSAQETDTGGTQNIDELSEATLRGMTQVYDKNYDDVTGGPFFYQTWLPGEVTLENGSTYRGTEVLYDVFNDQVLVRNQASNKIQIIDKEMVKSFHLGNNTKANMANFYKAALMENDLPQVKDDQFVQVLYEGDGFLYAVNRKQMKNNAFTDLEADYFYVGPAGNVHKLQADKKAILDTFSDKREALAEYIDGRDLDMRQRDDLVEAVMFYTTEVN